MKWTRFLVLWITLFAFMPRAHAIGTDYYIINSAGGGQVMGNSVDGWITVNGAQRAVTATGTAGSSLVTTPVKATIGTVADVAMSAARTITLAGTLKFAAKTVAGGVLFDAVAFPLAKALFDQFRCRQKAGDFSMAECDPGVLPTNTQQTLWGNPFTGNIFSTAAAACSSWAGFKAAQQGGSVASAVISNGATCNVTIMPTTGNPPTPYAISPGSMTQSSGYILLCPLKPDGSRDPVGFDGKCPVGTYTAKTPDQAGEFINTGMGGDYAGAGASGGWQNPQKIIEEGLKGGKDVQPFATDPAPAGAILSGPSTVQQPTTTTTTPAQNGQPATTVTTSPVAQVTYAGNKFTVGLATTTTNNNGTTTTTTTTTGAPAQPQPTDCDKLPNSVGCTDLGKTGDADPIPNQDVTAGNTPVNFATAGGCPSPVQFAISVGSYSHTFEISYQPLCDFCTLVQPLFIALFAAACAFIFYDGISKAVA